MQALLLTTLKNRGELRSETSCEALEICDYPWRCRLGEFSAYYKKGLYAGGILKLDGFLGRSLSDLFSNFTFFLNDPVFGDEINQHDSRLQEGLNFQYLRPYKLFGGNALLAAGSNFHANQIKVGLFPSVARNPNRLEPQT